MVCRHKVVTYGELAHEAGWVLRKGQQIAIRDKLRLEEWMDRATQQPRKMHKVIADQIAVVNPVRLNPISQTPIPHLPSEFAFGYHGALSFKPYGSFIAPPWPSSRRQPTPCCGGDVPITERLRVQGLS